MAVFQIGSALCHEARMTTWESIVEDASGAAERPTVGAAANGFKPVATAT